MVTDPFVEVRQYIRNNMGRLARIMVNFQNGHFLHQVHDSEIFILREKVRRLVPAPHHMSVAESLIKSEALALLADPEVIT